MTVIHRRRGRSAAAATLTRRGRLTVFSCAVVAVALVGCAMYPMVAAVVLHVDAVDTTVHVGSIRFLVIAACCSPLVALPVWGFDAVGRWLHRHRFRIGAAIVAFAVICDVNGSSMGWWNAILGGDAQEGVALGVPRAIRSDEYAVNTPFAFAQAYNDYGYVNQLIGNRDSDVFLIKDAPVWCLAEIFRPFHWGYILLGSSRGLAFYWSARLVCLVLCLYELFRLITRDRRLLSLFGSAVIAFSPIIQWWYAVNSLPEMIIAASLSIVLFRRYWNDDNSWHRLGYAAVICQCAGMFILALYPACQIPLAYLLLGLIVWVLVERRAHVSMSRRDVVGLLGCVAVTAGLLGSVLYMSWPTIDATLNTVYPGSRVSTGGDVDLGSLFNGPASMLYAVRDYVGQINAPETARIVDLFPLGIILAVWQLFTIKRKDALSIVLLVYCVVMGEFMLVGFPLWLSKITLMSMVTGNRCYLGFAIANVMLLLRCLGRAHVDDSERDGRRLSRRSIAPVGVVIVLYAVAVAYVCYRNNPAYIGRNSAFAVVAICMLIGFALALPYRSRIGRWLVAAALTVVVCSGAAVNPVQVSSAPIENQPVTQQVRAIDSQHEGVWIVSGSVGVADNLTQLLVANGVTTLNAVQVTPMMDLWHRIDPEGRWEEIYNRYAFVSITIAEQESDEPFSLVAADRIAVTLTAEQLDGLGVDYVLTTDDLSTLDGGEYRFEQVGAAVDGWTAYQLTAG